MSYETDAQAAKQFAERGDYDSAYTIADRWLKHNPEDVGFLNNMVYCLLATEKTTIAYNMAKRVTQLAPKMAAGWMNLGMAANDLWLDDEAVRYYKRGLKLSETDKSRSMFCVNLSSVLVDVGRFEEAEKYCKQALKYNPDSVKAKANLGFCQLAQRNWQEGWKNYRYCMGSEWRPRYTYNDEPEWDGKGKGVIVLSGEQGLGDEISFASMVPDMLAWAAENDSRVILDCEPRLEGLFKRSFPGAKVYGTRRAKHLNWDEEDQQVDYSIHAGQIAEYFRTSDGSFPGSPYLTPDPVRVLQWKALFEDAGKPVIGIAWRGGIPKTGAKFRQWDLEQLLPILESLPGARFVSLQYKPAGKEIAAFKEKYPHIDLVEYPHGTLTNDYDDTVAMIAAMDHVVCMQTAVTHVAGALGVPCWVFVPQNSQWRYGQGTEEYIWADSVRIMRQKTRGEWADVIKAAAEELSANFPRISGRTETDAPGDSRLRDDGRAVRANGRLDPGDDGMRFTP